MDIDNEIRYMLKVGSNDLPPYAGHRGNRSDLVTLFNKFGYKSGAEIGVWKGEFSLVLCQAIPDLKLILVDPWEPFKQSGETGSARLAVDRWRQTRRRMIPYPNVEFKKKTSVEAAKEVEAGSLDFVYIDALHDFDNVMMDLILWTPKVRIGGIVSGHDYFIGQGVNVVQAVNAYTYAHGIRNLYVTADDNECRSFFWVRGS